jgi:hypothetical protein
LYHRKIFLLIGVEKNEHRFPLFGHKAGTYTRAEIWVDLKVVSFNEVFWSGVKPEQDEEGRYPAPGM